jgi:hypothetical protein
VVLHTNSSYELCYSLYPFLRSSRLFSSEELPFLPAKRRDVYTSVKGTVIRVRKKGKTVPALNQALCHEAIHIGEWGIVLPFLTSALDGGEWSASRPGCFTLRERAPGTNWIGECVGPKAGLDAMEKIRTLSLPGIESWQSSL